MLVWLSEIAENIAYLGSVENVLVKQVKKKNCMLVSLTKYLGLCIGINVINNNSLQRRKLVLRQTWRTCGLSVLFQKLIFFFSQEVS